MEFIIGSVISIVTLITTVFIAIWQQRQSRNYPSLIPQSDLPLGGDSSLVAPVFDLRVQNSGSAMATNIVGVLVTANVSSQESYQQYQLQGKTSLSKKDSITILVQDRFMGNSQLKISKYTLSPPQNSELAARLTLFYEDDDNHLYISIFDYTNHHHWRQVKFLRDADKKASLFQDIQRSSSAEVAQIPTKHFYRTDTLEAPHIEKFCGRTQEIEELTRWIVTDKCRLIAILGIGGIGKTALTAKIVAEVKDEFSYVFWRSLQNAPPLKVILERCLLLLSDQNQLDMPKEEDEQITFLLQHLQKKRCLIVLDNVETVLQEGNRAGYYREGYEGYGRLLQLLGETQHVGCLLITSREKPKEIIRLEGKSFPIHSLELPGMGLKEGQEILNDRGVVGQAENVAELIQLYSGNPLALRLVVEPIQRLFGGNIAAFLQVKAAVFGDIYDLLEQQFHRLSDLERSILYWLAVEREAVPLEELSTSIIEEVRRRALLAALDSLQHRSMIETSSTGGFSLQPVIMEYTVERINEQACEEILAESIGIIRSHALIKAQTKDYVRESQIRLILGPLAQRLLSQVGLEAIEKKLKNMLLIQRQVPPHIPGYTAGNILNLLINLKSNLHGYDFSNLMICQAYLQGAVLPDVNFTNANFVKCVFTSTFGGIFSIALSPSEEMLAAGTDTGDIQIWNTASGAPLATYHEHYDWVRSVAFSPDGRILASCSDDQTIRLWDTSTSQRTQILTGHTDWVRSIAFHLQGNLLVSGSNDRTARIWDISSGQHIRTLQQHTAAVLSVAFDHQGQLLATASQDQTIKLWSIDTWQCIRTLIGHSSGVTVIAFHPDDHSIASGSEDRTVKIWDVNTGQCSRTLQEHTSPIRSLLFSQQGRILISASEDQTARFWDTNRGHCIKTLQGYTNGLRSIAFVPDGNTLISGSTDPLVSIWDVQRGRCTKTLAGHSKGVRSVAISSDSHLLATGSHDKTTRLWNVKTGKCLKTLQGHTDWIWAVVFRPDNQMLATGSHDQTIKLWNVESGQCIQTLQGHTGGIRALAMSKDGQLLASGGEDSIVKIWHLDSASCIITLQGHTGWVKSISFSPDGQFLVTGSEDHMIKVWDTETWQCVRTLHGHTGWVMATVFSPDGQFLASGSTGQEVKIWDTETWQCVRTLHGHTGWVMATVFSPDGQFLASGGDEGTIKFWNIQTGECIKTLKSGPYDGMDITHSQGLSLAQKNMLMALGAFEGKEDEFSS